ncbi:hypothetical protein CTEN210_14080 [Chaetoceros tenuissimus]|uniref:Calcineurin-like phosphoesterase domain-containing protein n=1 Tax=Chaetoceros tenuissimus TaxID=426638 RepID=A0AAD3HC03_9STRA|nr:hypothetical protein CTEN210_14080 [Chaetoceros tenuissimus]
MTTTRIRARQSQFLNVPYLCVVLCCAIKFTFGFHILTNPSRALLNNNVISNGNSQGPVSLISTRSRGRERYTHLLLQSDDENDASSSAEQKRKKGLEKDIEKYLRIDSSNKKGGKDETNSPSSSPYKQKAGTRMRMKRNSPRPKEGEHYKSILPPPPTKANEKFPDRSNRKDKFDSPRSSNRRTRNQKQSPFRSKLDSGNDDDNDYQNKKSNSRRGRGHFVKPRSDLSNRKFKPRNRRGYQSYKGSSQSTPRSPMRRQNNEGAGNELESGLTSWDDFFSNSSDDGRKMEKKYDGDLDSGDDNTLDDDVTQDYFDKSLEEQVQKISNLPSTSALFANTKSKKNKDNSKNQKRKSEKSKSSAPNKISSLPSLDGVLPVSELFYRSTQSLSANEESGEESKSVETGNDNFSRQTQETDDEELPFSAEQSDRILTVNNKILMRRNRANMKNDDKAQYKTDLAKLRSSMPSNTSKVPPKPNNQNAGRRARRKRGGNGRIQQGQGNNQGRGRKMVRRGMEMLVGGEPINADPPLRFVELNYSLRNPESLSDGLLLLKDEDSKDDFDSTDSLDWSSIITTNSRDFGPLLHKASVGKVSQKSKELYCEHFIHNSMKWNICPKDLKALVRQYENDKAAKSTETYEELIEKVSSVKFDEPQSIEMRFDEINTDVKPETKGFGKDVKKKKRSSTAMDFNAQDTPSDSDGMNRAARRNSSKQSSFTLGGELKFSLGITRSELESGHDGGHHGQILRRVFGHGIAEAIKAESLGFQVVISKMLLNEVDGGSTEFHVEFNMIPVDTMKLGEIEWATKKINMALAQAMDDGDMALAMGAAAKKETAWPAKIRKRIVEEFLFDAEEEDGDQIDDDEDEDLQLNADSESLDDEDDFESQREDEDLPKSNVNKKKSDDEFDGPFGMPGDTIYANDDIFLGGGNGGVFPDYSETDNGIGSAPFKGGLGPLLVDAVTQRAIERQPRIIAIGDVHGCIDELQALLRRCDYRPGDLIVFLGDLVSKGPDSLSVVQMARELGAIGVRGNHDFEVIRWHQAIKSGADPPVIGSEHYQIASTLSTADLRWMYSLPWYLSSKELNALFVHAGFVSGIRLGKQNPRLMMNMRSILPDGTVTSKFFNNWPWARLWDGPQTVLFGHDADRGLQQYEHAIGLDTGCVYGGRLTACILPEKRLVSVNAKREYFQYRRKHFD